ncbi:aldehyde dehydrogenase family protein [Ectopseudomonas oleovorans]|uniref:aldehyde dehydrogenase family protein n=1 Tax=Ectopseudomonas oleovorans TaxID=301 RepID=UPI0019D1ECF6|nr:aldehyde dehydrogenase family protein [Pseudomonas oleovorans]MBN7119926.1 aldehyde dehydrogenase [Pseudomonas oleovorans]MBN7133043.1 aldehyde dehydrogenase [Pseudomonas oleovorans]MBN7139372.1 aldehyde dehydrogenase [Pseudomonas oleovorans]
MNTLTQQHKQDLHQLLQAFGLSGHTPLSNWIAGSARAGDGAAITLTDPVTGEALLDYNDAGAALVSQAVAGAQKGQAEWMKLSASERGRRMLQALSGLQGREEDLAKLESLVAGKPIRDCRAEVAKVREMFEYYAGWCDKQHGLVIPVPTSHLNYVHRVPYGVVGQITPWNAPMFTCAWQLAPAIAAGNAVVLKPSELTPFTSIVIAACLEKAGLPEGLINIVNGLGPTTGSALTGHQEIAKLVFVGSPGSGRLIAQAGAQRLVPTVLELGGKSANIIFEDACLDEAVAGAQAAIFGAAGQSCVAGSRLLVQESLLEAVCERLAKACPRIQVGLPSSPETQMGPLQNGRQHQHVSRMIRDAVNDGATIVTGGGLPQGLPTEAQSGYFVAPTVLRNVTPSMEIAQEEVFGPVVVVMPFTDEQHAISLANSTRFGLAGAVWTQNVARGHRVARQLRVGTVWVNSYKSISVMSPFGGFGESGYGRSSGTEGLQEYTLPQSIWVETAEKASIAMGYGSGD